MDMQWKVPGRRWWQSCMRKLCIKLRMIQISIKLLRRRTSRKRVKELDLECKAPRITSRSFSIPIIPSTPSAGLLYAILPVTTFTTLSYTYPGRISAIRRNEPQEGDVFSTSALSDTSDDEGDVRDNYKPSLGSGLSEDSTRGIYEAITLPGKESAICESTKVNDAAQPCDMESEKQKTVVYVDRDSFKAGETPETPEHDRSPTSGRMLQKAESTDTTKVPSVPSSPEVLLNLTEQKTPRKRSDNKTWRGTFVNGLFVPEESSLYSELQQQMELHRQSDMLHWNQTSSSWAQPSSSSCPQNFTVPGTPIFDCTSPWFANSQPMIPNMPNQTELWPVTPDWYTGNLPDHGTTVEHHGRNEWNFQL